MRSGAKTQTVRPIPSRMPAVGDILDARQWSGRPYNSPQTKILEATITRVARIDISETGIAIDSYAENAQAIAKADGFKDEFEMLAWFKAQHGLPFAGILIQWEAPQL